MSQRHFAGGTNIEVGQGFTRKKHDACFPAHAIHYCLDAAKFDLDDIDHVVFSRSH